MVKSVAAELEDEQGDAAMSGNVENLDVELDFVSKDSEAYVYKFVYFFYITRKNCTCRNNLC